MQDALLLMKVAQRCAHLGEDVQNDFLFHWLPLLTLREYEVCQRTAIKKFHHDVHILAVHKRSVVLNDVGVVDIL